MCGIAGLYVPSGRQTIISDVDRMTRRLHHRGPDHGDVWSEGNLTLALGHRRLSIMDPVPRSDQPMHSACGNYVIVYNGEIYNHKELRLRFRDAGHGLKTTSDTEVLVEAISAFGLPQTLEMIEGMFAFAVWDRSARKLTLCRDRFGIKPCYWMFQSGIFGFASELKSLLGQPDLLFTPHAGAIRNLLDFGYVDSPRTALTEVQQVEPGTLISVSSKGILDHKIYWHLPSIRAHKAKTPSRARPEQLLADFDNILTASVDRYLCADMPVGSFLSGGIDSSLITAIAAQRSSQPIKTFSIGFAEQTWNEADRAEKIAAHIGTDHHCLQLSATDAQDLVSHLPDVYDEPFADFSQLPTLALCQFARAQVSVCLSGDGGDELFGGYSRYKWAPDVWNGISKFPKSARAALLGWMQHKRLPALALNIAPDRIAFTVKELNKVLPFGMSISDFPEFYGRIMRTGAQSLFDGSPPDSGDAAVLPAMPGQSAIDMMQVYDLRHYMGDGILTKVDRASMSVGLEVRIPLLCERIADFAFGLPETLRFTAHEQRILQRSLAYRYVPRNLLDAPKMGFGFPIDSWLRGALRDWADDLLSVTSLQKVPYLRHRRIAKLWSDHRIGLADHHWQLWPVLMYVQWFTRWSSCLTTKGSAQPSQQATATDSASRSPVPVTS